MFSFVPYMILAKLRFDTMFLLRRNHLWIYRLCVVYREK
jgi:hypothetical protein